MNEEYEHAFLAIQKIMVKGLKALKEENEDFDPKTDRYKIIQAYNNSTIVMTQQNDSETGEPELVIEIQKNVTTLPPIDKDLSI